MNLSKWHLIFLLNLRQQKTVSVSPVFKHDTFRQTHERRPTEESLVGSSKQLFLFQCILICINQGENAGPGRNQLTSH